jgi:hypothetical protein
MVSTDEWFVRLPDGSVVVARSSAAVRHHLESGRLPRDVQLRRSPRDPWGSLERFDAFADLAPPRSRAAARSSDGNTPGGSNANLNLEAVGVRGYLDRLGAALDGTLQPARLWAAAMLGGGGGVAVATAQLAALLAFPWSLAVALTAGVAAWLLQGWAVVVLTRLTSFELAQLRPADWRRVTAGLGGRLAHYLLAQALLGLLCGGALLALRLPATLVVPDNLSWLPPVLAGVGTVVRLVLEVLFWLLLGLGPLLAPVVVVEECSAWQALRQWLGLLRRHAPRVLMYEAMALVTAAVLAVPLALAVAVAGWSVAVGADPVGTAALTVLGGLALTPALAFLATAHVYIYVNLRYEVD